jgi:small subunit ribosomal protein S1
MDGDPISDYMNEHPKGKLVTGTVVEVDARGAEIELAEGVIAYMRASEMSLDQVDDARKLMKEGDSVEALLVGVDRKKRSINLSIKAKDSKDEKDAIKEYSSSSESGATTLGDLLKEQMDK